NFSMRLTVRAITPPHQACRTVPRPSLRSCVSLAPPPPGPPPAGLPVRPGYFRPLAVAWEGINALKINFISGYNGNRRYKAFCAGAEPPTTVNRMPEGCREARQQEEERQRQQAERKEKEARAALEERQRQEAKPKGLEYARTSRTTWKITRKKSEAPDKVDVTVESVQK